MNNFINSLLSMWVLKGPDFSYYSLLSLMSSAMRCHITFLNNITSGDSTSRLRMIFFFFFFMDKWVKQLEIHKTKLSKDNKDCAYKGKVNHTDAKWETSDKVSKVWNS